MASIDPSIAITPSQPYVRMRRTVAEYYKLYELGLIDPVDFRKSEIIDGELVRKMGIGDTHAWIVDFLSRFFNRNLPDTIRVHNQNPVRLGDYDEPEPDIVLSDLTKYDGKRHPTPAETILVIEVAESSFAHRSHDKAIPLRDQRDPRVMDSKHIEPDRRGIYAP